MATEGTSEFHGVIHEILSKSNPGKVVLNPSFILNLRKTLTNISFEKFESA
jgi:hypothetical protein